MTVWPWRKRGEVQASPPSVDGTRSDAAHPVGPPRVHPALRLELDYVYPDYVDQEALAAIAQAKGVTVDPVILGLAENVTRGWSSMDELAGSIRTPVSEVGGKTSTTESEETSIGRSIAIQRRQTMRWVVDELTDVLRAEGALREDLAFVPDECENEFALVLAARQAKVAWGLSEIVQKADTALAEGKFGADSPTDAQQGVGRPGTEWNPQRPMREQLALSVQTLTYAAGDVVREAMLRSVEDALANEAKTLFALVTVRWGNDSRPNQDSFRLFNTALVSRAEPDIVALGPAPTVLEVPLSKAKLNPLARGRYVSTGPFQPFQVFAKIERVERKAGRWIVLTPIVILSA